MFNSTAQNKSVQPKNMCRFIQSIRTKLTLTAESLQDICTFVLVLMVWYGSLFNSAHSGPKVG